jgi:hypothetical protein
MFFTLGGGKWTNEDRTSFEDMKKVLVGQGRKYMRALMYFW